jgi:hypothetical protein
MKSLCAARCCDKRDSATLIRRLQTILDVQRLLVGETYIMGGVHQQTSERAAPPVSVEEKGKATDNKKINAIISAYEHTILKFTVCMLLEEPQNTIKSHLVFTALFCFAPFSVFSSRMSAPYTIETRSRHSPRPCDRCQVRMWV